MIKVPFSIELYPVSSNARTVQMKIVHFSPLDMEIIKNKVLHHPPFLAYGEGETTLDLNAFDVISKIPVGAIRTIELKEDNIVVHIGL